MYRPLTLILLLFLNTNLFAKEDIHITAYSAILMNSRNKKILYSKNPHTKLAPASTAKLMTALIVLKRSGLDKEVKISSFAASMPPSKVHLKEGELYRTEDLLKALLLNSGNDASVALAENVATTEEKFVEMMNDMAKRIGARNTHFKTSNGLPAKDQYSTAYDLALIVREVMKDKRLMAIMKMKNVEIRELISGRRIKLRNHNKGLSKNVPYLMLGKTGYTIKAGHCFAGHVHYNRWRNEIVVVLKSRKLWSDLKKLASKN